MLGVDAVAVVMANPVIMQDLHTDVTGVMWATSAYLLTYSVPQLITGRLGDQFGPRNVYLWGLVLFTLCSLWCGLATSIGMLIVARTAQGFGAALIAPQVVALTVRTFPPDKRGEAMGLAGAMAGLAELVGLVLGGMLVGWFGWNWIFYVNVPIGVIGFALAWVCVPVMETYPRRFDLVGVGLFTVGMFLLVSGIQEGNTQRWNAWIWGTIAVGLVVLVVFLVGQAHNTSESLLPLNLFSDRNFALSNIATMALGAAMPMVLVPIYFWLQEVRDFSPVRAGALFAPAALATMVLRPVMGSISDRLHPRLLPTLGFSLFAAVAVGFAVLMTPDGSILDRKSVV